MWNISVFIRGHAGQQYIEFQALNSSSCRGLARYDQPQERGLPLLPNRGCMHKIPWNISLYGLYGEKQHPGFDLFLYL